ncbi:hypothetical protein BD311DRAFT_768009 [Dichomitus squalens]|uniref:Uncharacterized protein n=1 Tax=Dichomitus squalens TaxID=114155 RepID=A0A4Q9MB23_9APHY|nr:hypothetical protein BD311DRAFT_768009 [Dichomitus squalens]
MFATDVVLLVSNVTSRTPEARPAASRRQARSVQTHGKRSHCTRSHIYVHYRLSVADAVCQGGVISDIAFVCASPSSHHAAGMQSSASQRGLKSCLYIDSSTSLWFATCCVMTWLSGGRATLVSDGEETCRAVERRRGHSDEVPAQGVSVIASVRHHTRGMRTRSIWSARATRRRVQAS